MSLPKEYLRRPIVIDEIQKIPELLDEVHLLIEDEDLSFILCGSSARKLKHGQANLLGGRAWRFEMFPLTFEEIPAFDLLHALQHGLLPSHYLSKQPNRSLKAYVRDYLKEEIQSEGIVRSLRSFSKFLDCAAICHGQVLNYSKIASDVGVDSKTVRNYFDIAEDTLIGRFLPPFSSGTLSRKDLFTSPKFYLFDSGVTRTLRKTEISGITGAEAGLLFEGYMFHELSAYLSYRELNRELSFLKTHDGKEIDFVVGNGELLIEVTISSNIRATDVRGLNSLMEVFPSPKKALVICTESQKRLIRNKSGSNEIAVYPWKAFLEELWNGKLLS